MLVEMKRFFIIDDKIGDIFALEVVDKFLLKVLKSNSCWGWLNPSLMTFYCA